MFYYLFLSQAYSKGSDFSYPIISDPSREIAVSLGMVDPEEKDKAGLPLTCRAVSLEQPALIIVLISGGGGGEGLEMTPLEILWIFFLSSPSQEA